MDTSVSSMKSQHLLQLEYTAVSQKRVHGSVHLTLASGEGGGGGPTFVTLVLQLSAKVCAGLYTSMLSIVCDIVG